MVELASIGTVMLAGFFRGVTGFGGAMLMTPILSALIGPVPAVVTALILETTAALVMVPDALLKAQWRILLFLTLPAIMTVPIGGYLLLTLDPAVARKLIAAVVVVFSLILLFGHRYRGSPRPATSIALGSLAGVLLGATSVGAPPVILYLLSGSDSVAVTRANLTVFITSISVIGLSMLVAAGAVNVTLGISAGLLTVPFVLAIWVGGKTFARLSDASVRRFALVLMLCFGICGFVI